MMRFFVCVHGLLAFHFPVCVSFRKGSFSFLFQKVCFCVPFDILLSCKRYAFVP